MNPTSSASTAKPRLINGAEAGRQALREAMQQDPRVIVFGEDVADPEGGGVMTVTKGLSTEFGEQRVRSTPISEQAIVGAAVGAAIAGLRPVAEIMLMNFITVAMDQLVNHAAKIRFMSGGKTAVPLTIRTMTGAGAGLGGQHSDMLEAWLAHVPGLKVVTPSSHADWTGLLAASIFDDNPVVFIEPTLMMMAKGEPAPPGHRLPLGKAGILRAGRDVSVIGYGRPIAEVLVLAERLAAEGLSVEVIDLRTIAPYDRETVLASVARTRRAVVVHEAVRSFGVGAEIAAMLQEALYGHLLAPVRRVASKHTPVPFSSELEKAFLWNLADVEAAIRSTVQ